METITLPAKELIHEGRAIKAFIKSHRHLTVGKVAEACGYSRDTLDRRLEQPVVEMPVYVAIHMLSGAPLSEIFTRA